MRSRNPWRQSDQLRLFRPTAPLQWSEVPAEARERTVILLARMLRDHARARREQRWRDE